MKRILFVCVENAGRSQRAEAFFNHPIPAGMEAISAGTNPASSVNPTVLKVMQEAGLDLSSKRPKLYHWRWELDDMKTNQDLEFVGIGGNDLHKGMADRQTANEAALAFLARHGESQLGL